MARNPSIAELSLGLSERDEPLKMLSRAYEHLTGEQCDGQDLLDRRDRLRAVMADNARGRKGQLTLYESPPEISDQAVLLGALSFALVDSTEHPYATVLGTWPLYQETYLSHARRVAAPPSRDALLIGSLSAVSSAAFTAFSEYVMQAEPWIVDPRYSLAKERHGNFVPGSGLALPEVWSNTMHSVVTNRLTGMLLKDGELTTHDKGQHEAAVQRLASNMFRVLQYGGHLLMCEWPAGFETSDIGCLKPHNQQLMAEFEPMMRDTLGDAGFTDITIEAGWHPTGTEHFFEPLNLDEPYANKRLRPETRMIYARKPPQTY